MSKSELACVYAALILHDDGVDVTVSCICQHCLYHRSFHVFLLAALRRGMTAVQRLC